MGCDQIPLRPSRHCRRLIKCIEKGIKPKRLSRTNSEGNIELIINRLDYPSLEDIIESSDSEEDSEELESLPKFSTIEGSGEGELPNNSSKDSTPTKPKIKFEKWQRIIRLNAIRANAEWVPYSPSQAGVFAEIAQHLAESVGLKDYDNLEPCRIFHTTPLVSILEAYTLYDPVTGYCQGMSDILSPMIAVIEEGHEAFWCFADFMRKTRHNFRLDEEGITAQLTTISKIIKLKDPYLYKHLEKLQADNCFFVYRMVVLLFKNELTFEQT
ncbi:hypothetical protein GIB67_040432 [Kingdonia uniflora]|uniref:Rab-GAP TBC domain-containing protein n=1 Tax=Kingdonia uniflora TaxID=39325 RepID=A0A7J7KXM4_9MAGN|nr:hypothetical protein GIB67_040432 [Kingdonia uniflora]